MPSRSYYRPKTPVVADAIYRVVSGREVQRDPQHVPQLPKIDSRRTLAEYIGVDESLITWMIREKSKHYRTYSLEKKRGWRRIDAPRTYLKVVQHWILDNILANCSFHESVHGFVPGRSPLTNARSHVGCKEVLNVDIQNFFGSINRLMVEKMYADLGYSPKVASDLMELTTFDGRLPQGAPTSPYLANLYLTDFDEELVALLADTAAYTRYADDLTISSTGKLNREPIEIIIELLKARGLKLNRDKTKWMSSGDRFEITGYSLSAFVQKPKYWRKNARALLHQAELNSKFREENYYEINGVLGLVEGMSAANEGNCLHRQAARVRRLLRPATPPTS